MKKRIQCVFLILLGWNLSLRSQAILDIDPGQSGTPMSQDLIGVFFEDINYGADGGLYAELIQNRSFEYYTVTDYVTLDPYTAWSIVTSEGAIATMQIENSYPLNTNNTHYLKLDITDAGTEVGIKNSGYMGISVISGDIYDFSVYMRTDSVFQSPVIVQIRNSTGTVIACDTITGVTDDWTLFSSSITSNQTSGTGSLYLVTTGTGTLYFDMVSLFPRNTFKNRRNGLRKDLALAIADLQPRFLRFPGGCISHGRGNDNAYRWKHTVGDVAQRKPNWNLWGYHQTYGLGFFEFFQFCEDIGAKPLPVLPVGVSCQFRDREIVPLDQMGPWVEDAIDLIEFTNGDTNTVWGSLRAEMGHPEPFNMEYLCLGNEEDDISEFRERFTMIGDSLKKYHPEIKIIGTAGTSASGTYYNSLWQFSRDQNLYAVDEHYYMSPSWFLDNIHRYDNFDRSGPKVFIGEYASQNDLLNNAIAEAAYLTGIEKNADVIQFTCYAPLLCNENINQWNPDLIRFDNTRVVKTASYYVQQLYSLYTGDTCISSIVSYEEEYDPLAAEYTGSIGLGTWNTKADFDDINLVCGEEILIDENFSSGASNWQVASGTFTASGGIYSQSSGLTPAVSLCKTQTDTSSYVLTLKARKTGGLEGFLIPFGYKNSQNYYWLNIAGWSNTQHAVEKCTGGTKSVVVSKSGSISNNTWYTIKIEINRTAARFYLNNSLLFSISSPSGPVTASVVKDHETNEMILKIINAGTSSINTTVSIKEPYINQEATLITFQGSPSQRNSLSSPNTLIPVENSIQVSNKFECTLPSTSFQIIRIKMDQEYQGIRETSKERKGSKVKIIPNPFRDRTQIIFEEFSEEPYELAVYDVAGRMVYKQMNITSKSVELDRDPFRPGTYIIELKADKRIYTEKFIILGN